MSTGLLVLCSPLSHLHHHLGPLLTAAVQHTSEILYVQLEPGQPQLWPRRMSDNSRSPDFLNSCGNFIANFYKTSFGISQSLDVRFLLSNLKQPTTEKIVLNHTVDVVLTDSQLTPLVEKYLTWRFKNYKVGTKIIHIPTNDGAISTSQQMNGLENSERTPFHEWQAFDSVVLGGTFDLLHSGHKILLSDAILRCKRQLTIGVTDGPMLKSKKLWELIQPIDIRISALQDFLTDVDGTLKYKSVAITDPFGPSTEDPELQCIVVSEETIKGGIKVNEERQKKGMSTLHVHTIDLIPDDAHSNNEELKISSSSLRMRNLGTRRNVPVEKSHLPKFPYIIGLTGGIASGKSSIAKRLGGLGAAIIDCDKLAHLSYSIGRPAYNAIIQTFGSGIVDEDGTINRQHLGKEVFGNKSKLETLNKIVWPEIRRLVTEQIQLLAATGVPVVIIEAAVLFEAGWDRDVHEVWVSIIPENEAVQRLKDRNGLDETQARQRIDKQMTNVERVSRATVVFCTFWEPQYTQKQVEKAWKELNEYLHQKTAHSTRTFKL